MIRTINLKKIFSTKEIETTAMHEVNIEIAKGEFVAFMGPSGCGKTTLLNILGLLDSPTSGEYYFNGIEVSGYNETKRTLLRKSNISFIFQNFNLIEELNVFQNIELPLIALKINASERKRKIEQILEQLEIAHRKYHFPQQLSGGQQQRVAIARAIIPQPQLILADEPTGNLDSAHGEQVMEILEKLNIAGTTIVMVTHSTEHAAWAHRTLQMLDGKIFAQRTGSKK